MRNKILPPSWFAALHCLVAFYCLVITARADETRTIDGQVFIRTKGGDNIKLSLVDVLLFDAKLLSENLEQQRSRARPLERYIEPLEIAAHARYLNAEKADKSAFDILMKDVLNKQLDVAWKKASQETTQAVGDWTHLHNRLIFLRSSYFFFAELPRPQQASKTDADGKFSFKVPIGSYALKAQSSRKAGSNTEFYNWIVRVQVDGDKKIMLANDNLADSGSADSMIQTPSDEFNIPLSAEALNFDSVSAFVEQDKRDRVAVELAKKEAARKALAAKQEMERQTELAVFRKNPKAAQQKAIELYPDVGVAGSALNKEFVDRAKRYRTEKKEFFTEPDWPVRLAKECSETLAAKPAAK